MKHIKKQKVKHLNRKNRIQLYENGWYIEWDKNFRNYKLKRMAQAKKSIDTINSMLDFLNTIEDKSNYS